MKSIKSILLVLVLLMGFVAVTGCNKGNSNNSSGESLVGSWAQGDYMYTFNEDNTCVYDVGGAKMECTYETSGKNISIYYNGSTVPFTSTYTIDGSKLTIIDSFGNDTVYEKK